MAGAVNERGSDSAETRTVLRRCGDSGRCLAFLANSSSSNCSAAGFGCPQICHLTGAQHVRVCHLTRVCHRCPCEHWYFHYRDPNLVEPDWYGSTDLLSHPVVRRTPTICCAAYQSCEDCRKSRCSWCRTCGANTCVTNVTAEDGTLRREDPYLYRHVLFNSNLSFAESYESKFDATISYRVGYRVIFNESLQHAIEVSAGKFETARCTQENCSCDTNGTSSTFSPWNKDCGCGCQVIMTNCTQHNCSCGLTDTSSGVEARVVTNSIYGPCGCECVESSRVYCTAQNCSCSPGVSGGLSLTHTIKNYDCGCSCSRATLPDQLTMDGCIAAGGEWTWSECAACRGRYGCSVPEGSSKCGPYPDPLFV